MFLIQEKKIIRRMFRGAMLKNGVYRRRTNNEAVKELSGRNVLEQIKILRIKWLGHIYRKKTGDDVRTLTWWCMDGGRARGRAGMRLIDEVEEYLKEIGVKARWKTLVQDCGR